jgi:putrescine aminotransferase
MSLAAVSVTGREIYRQPFQPLLPDVEFVPFGQAGALRDALDRSPEACVLLEPVQAEAGVIIPPHGYLREVEQVCRARGAFLIIDEIQTGLGRLGRWWGVDCERVTPDVLLVGKGLSGGIVPVSAAVGSARVFRPLSRDPLIHTSTFSGAPIAMAAAKTTIETMEEEDAVGHAASLGERLGPMVATVVTGTCPDLVREIRCVGLLIAIEWNADYLAIDFLTEMLDRRVILSHSMNAANVIRLTPPAFLTDEDLLMLESALRDSCRALAER